MPAEYQAIISSEELFDSYKSGYVEKENNRRINEYKTKNPDATAEEIAAKCCINTRRLTRGSRLYNKQNYSKKY